MRHFTFHIAFDSSTEPDLELIGDIRLYNKKELCEELQDGLQADARVLEILARCYRKWGVDCLQRLVGDFSFVLWDRNKKILFAARDHLGIKQLYYKGSPDKELLFSSSIREIMEGKIDAAETINSEVFVDYLLGLDPEQDRTIFSSIRQLPPGHFLTVTGNRLQVERYWRLVISSSSPFGAKKFDKQQFLAVLETVLRSRWEEGKNNILLLSGGLDSTSLLCALRSLIKVEKEAITILSHLAPQDEAEDGGDFRYIQLVLEQLGMEARFTHEPSGGLNLSTLDDYFDSQFRMPWSPLVVRVSPLEMAYSGVKGSTVISGIGGDETVSVDPEDKALYLLFSGRLFSLLRCLQRHKEQSGLSLARIFYHKILFRLLPLSFQEFYRKLRGVSIFDKIENSVIHSSLMNKTEQKKRLDSKRKLWKNWNKDPRKEIRNTLESGYFTAPLEHAAAISERSGITFNLPFLDRRIVEFCLTVPGIEFVRNGVPRCFLRNCMQDFLPKEIAQRETKQLISHTDDISMLLSKELFYAVTDKINSPAWDYIDRERLIAAYSDLEEGKVREQERPRLGAQLSRALCAAAFLEWFEIKKKSSTS